MPYPMPPFLSFYIPETTLEADTDWVRAFITRAVLVYGASVAAEIGPVFTQQAGGAGFYCL